MIVPYVPDSPEAISKLYEYYTIKRDKIREEYQKALNDENDESVTYFMCSRGVDWMQIEAVHEAIGQLQRKINNLEKPGCSFIDNSDNKIEFINYIITLSINKINQINDETEGFSENKGGLANNIFEESVRDLYTKLLKVCLEGIKIEKIISPSMD